MGSEYELTSKIVKIKEDISSTMEEVLKPARAYEQEKSVEAGESPVEVSLRKWVVFKAVIDSVGYAMDNQCGLCFASLTTSGDDNQNCYVCPLAPYNEMDGDHSLPSCCNKNSLFSNADEALSEARVKVREMVNTLKEIALKKQPKENEKEKPVLGPMTDNAKYAMSEFNNAMEILKAEGWDPNQIKNLLERDLNGR